MIACTFVLGLLAGIVLTEVSLLLVIKLVESREEPTDKN